MNYPIYTAIGRCKNSVKVSGFILKSLLDNSVRFFTRQEVEKLALNKAINNIMAQEYEGKIILKGINCKIRKLPEFSADGIRISDKQMSKVYRVIVARVLKGKATIYYLINTIQDGVIIESSQVERKEVIRLAKDKQLDNARVQMSQGKAVLRGINCDLTRLPTYTESEISSWRK